MCILFFAAFLTRNNMLFSSISFLYYFLPCVLLLYFIAPKKLKNPVLLIFSLGFYAWGEPLYVLYMLGSIAVGYIAGLLIEKSFGSRKTSLARLVTAVSVGLHFVVLFYFKVQPTLPIGISFFSFQVASYIIDVYRKDVKAQRNPFDFAMYVSLFPQLIAGPIVRYIDIERQVKSRTHTFEKTANGIRRFVIGLAKKVLLANTLGELCEIFRNSDEKSVLFYWMYAIGYTLHIYFDFSGYSDMAIGLGKIFGFDFLENFNYPYISGSVTEFWRRWHMSLGSWFRDYVYIPLGGNRVSKPRYYFNIFVVWAFTGLWHGGAWNFVLWGLYFAILLIIEKNFLLKILNKSKIFKHIYLLLAVILGFVLFDAASLPDVIEKIGAMFGAGAVPAVSAQAVYYLKSYAVIFVLAIIGSTPFIKSAAEKYLVQKTSVGKYLEPLVLLALFAASTAYLVDGSFNPFLYFRF